MRLRSVVVSAIGICSAIIVSNAWLIFRMLVERGVVSIPRLFGVDLNEVVLSIRLYSPAELANNTITVIGPVRIPGILGFYIFLSIALIGFLVPWYIESGRRLSELNNMRRQVFETLQFLAAYLRTGVTLPRALLSLARSIGEPLGSRLYSYALLVNVHVMNHDRAFETVFNGVPRDVRTLLGILNIAIRGGKPAEILSSAAAHASNIRRFDELRASRLAGSTVVVFIGVLAYVITSIIVSSIIELFSGVGVSALGTRILRIGVPAEHILVIYYISSIVIALLGSILIARIIKGLTIAFVRYFLWIMVSIVLCFIFLKPIVIAVSRQFVSLPLTGAWHVITLGA